MEVAAPITKSPVRELNYLELQTDIHRARETRKKWNAIEKDMRRHPKRVF
jgi:hypothetical protein